MVWVEHDMQMVADLADRLCVLDYGTVIAEGQPAAVLADPRVVAAYLGATATSTPAATA
jgi:branched-chain amino acid transport system ATP-binding protein